MCSPCCCSEPLAPTFCLRMQKRRLALNTSPEIEPVPEFPVAQRWPGLKASCCDLCKSLFSLRLTGFSEFSDLILSVSSEVLSGWTSGWSLCLALTDMPINKKKDRLNSSSYKTKQKTGLLGLHQGINLWVYSTIFNHLSTETVRIFWRSSNVSQI